MTGIRVTAEPFDGDVATALIADLDADLAERYPDEGLVPVDIEAAHFSDDDGVFLVAWDGDVAVACGGVRRVDETTGEVKRMYVVPAARGRGISSVILRALEAAAAGLRLTHLVLETGIRQPEAMALYERAGWTPMPCFPPFDRVRLSRCYQKHIGGDE